MDYATYISNQIEWKQKLEDESKIKNNFLYNELAPKLTNYGTDPLTNYGTDPLTNKAKNSYTLATGHLPNIVSQCNFFRRRLKKGSKRGQKWSVP